MESSSPYKTSGDSTTTETQALEAFDVVVENAKAFQIFREVRGEYIHPRPKTVDKTGRIDRILLPLEKAIAAGWTYGAIGIEGKKPGEKIGRPLSQCLDYSRCVFELPTGLLVMLRWVFLYPHECGGELGPLGSIMAQQRIGWCQPRRLGGLILGCEMTHLITISDDGSLVAKLPPMGDKRGNRS